MLQFFAQSLLVTVFQEDSLHGIAAGHHVVNRAGEFDPLRPRHDILSALNTVKQGLTLRTP